MNLLGSRVGVAVLAMIVAFGCSEAPPNRTSAGTGGDVPPPSSGGTTSTGGTPSTGGGPSIAGAQGGTGGSGAVPATSSGGSTAAGVGAPNLPSGSGGATGLGAAGGGGGAPGAGGAIAGWGGVTGGGTQESPDLIAATHADGYLQLFPANPVVAIGPWFTYNWGTSNCNIAPKSGAQVRKGTGGICFSGQSCTGTAPGAGLGVKICTTPGDLTGWTEMQTFMAGHGITGTNVPYGFGQCNTGNKIVAIKWVGSVPNGAIVDLHDAADLSLIMLPVAAGATSVAVPASIDGGKIASVHLAMNGATVASWNFCVSNLTLSYQ